MANPPVWAWLAVSGLIVVLLAVDLRFHARSGQVNVRRAVIATAGWIVVSVAFGVVLGVIEGRTVAEQYFSAYLLEKSLSIDNVFLFAVLFEMLAVPLIHQPRVLHYGVVGALVLRFVFIAAGAAVLDELSWTFYVFGFFVAFTGIRLARPGHEVHPDRNLAIRAARRLLPVTPDYVGDRFFVHQRGTGAGGLAVTPLLVALVAVEASDIVFAVDSIPAVFGVTRDVFVVFTSNAFAMLGLRSLYFVLAGALDRFTYLKYGLAGILVFIGVKMLLASVIHVSAVVSLAVIAVVLAASAIVSLRGPQPKRTKQLDRAGTP
jgi:TerC family integral membrane protein